MKKRDKYKIITCLCMLLSFLLCACGQNTPQAQDNTTWYTYDSTIYSEGMVKPEIGTVSEPIDVQVVYSSMTYVPEMFYGVYRLSHPSDSIRDEYPSQSFVNACQWVPGEDIMDENPYLYEFSSMPYAMSAGFGCAGTWDKLLLIDEYDWCMLHFAQKSQDGDIGFERVMAAYEIDGSNITYHILKEWSYDEQTGEVEYEFTDNYLTYSFLFEGPSLTLISNQMQVKMYSEQFCYSQMIDEYFSIDAKAWDGEARIDNIETISIMCASENCSYNDWACFTINENGEEKEYYGTVLLSEDGLITFSYKDDNGNMHTHQYVIFYCATDGIILTDGEKTYYYTATTLAEERRAEIEALGMNFNKEDAAILNQISSEKLEALLQTRHDLLADLEKVFNENNIAVTVNKDSGELSLNAEVLFATNEYALTSEGEEVVRQFTSVLSEVLSEEKYNGFISDIVIQGHTDTNGEYEYNLELSQQRAQTVLDYCIGQGNEAGSSLYNVNELLYAEGCSYDFPVYNNNGEIDMDASRRVSFIFHINVEE